MEHPISMTPIQKPKNLNENVYESIKAHLTSGKLELDTIFSANQFAEILGVSRTPVRDALIQLTSEGYIVSVQKRGFKIREFSKKEIMDFFETRKIVEVYVIKHIAKTIKEKDLIKLSTTLNLMKDYEKQGNNQGFIEADRDFHMVLIYKYNNHLLSSIMENIRNSMALFGKKVLAREGRPFEVIQEHEDILRELTLKSPKMAAKALSSHLDITQKYLLESLNKLITSG